MSQRLPDHLDPWRFADLAKRVTGSFALRDLSRLCDALADSQGDVSFDVEFIRDGQHRACLSGTVEALLILECQRCLETMCMPVKSRVYLAFVEGLDEAELLPDEIDPQLVENGRIVFKDLIEDELLLALPQVPMHPPHECAPVSDKLVDDEQLVVQESPFAVLSELKRHDK